jgi:hypothetical protein
MVRADTRSAAATPPPASPRRAPLNRQMTGHDVHSFKLSPVSLRGAKPLRKGRARLVFQHPALPDVLIKIPRKGGVDAVRATQPVWRFDLISRLRYGRLMSWHWELTEYLALLSRRNAVPKFVAPFYGFCQTSRGVGMMVGKITDETGELAPSLSSLIRAGDIDPSIHQLIDQLMDRLQATRTYADDLHTGNIVVAGDGRRRRLVIIDGLGESLPLRAISPWLHSRWVARKRARLHELVRLRQSGS